MRKTAIKKQTKETPSDNLTVKERLFIDYYLGEARFNATQAARLCGYKATQGSLWVIGSRLLRKVKHLIDERLEQETMSSNEILAELKDVAASEWRDHIITVRNNKGEVVDAFFQLRDKLKALELLGKYHKLFVDKSELDVTSKGETIVLRPDPKKQ